MERLFKVGCEYDRREIARIAGARLRAEASAVYRFDYDDWVMLLDEGNGYWTNRLSESHVLMEVNPRKPTLNALIARARECRDRTYVLYRRAGRPQNVFRFLGEVHCVAHSGDFLKFAIADPSAALGALPPATSAQVEMQR